VLPRASSRSFAARPFAARLLRRCLLTLGCAGALALADAATARSALADIVVFEDINFRGHSLRIDGPVPDLRRFRFNDEISSIRVFEGAWEICEDINFQGRCVVIDRDVIDMRRLGMNDVISSIRPVRPRGWNDRDDDRRPRGWGK
jgi:hypothetical protein